MKYLFTAKYKGIIEERNYGHLQDIYVLYRNVNLNELVLQAEEVSEVKYVHYKEFEKMIKEENSEIVKHDEIYYGVLEELHEKFEENA